MDSQQTDPTTGDSSSPRDDFVRGEPGAEPGPLAHIPLFAGLPANEQKLLFDLMTTQTVEAHQTVFWLGDVGDTLYLISSGQVAVTVPNEKGEHVTLDSLGPGGFFGEISLLDGGPRTATIRTLERTELYVLDRDDLHACLRQRPEVAIHLLTIMGRRQRVSTEAQRSMRNPNVVFERSRVSRWQKASDAVASMAAKQWFILVHLSWFGIWIALNVLAAFGLLPAVMKFDPFPFGILTMIVSLESILLSIFVMVSQNRQSEKDRIRTDLDYQVNVKAQTEVNMLSRKIDRLEALLRGESNS